MSAAKPPRWMVKKAAEFGYTDPDAIPPVVRGLLRAMRNLERAENDYRRLYGLSADAPVPLWTPMIGKTGSNKLNAAVAA